MPHESAATRKAALWSAIAGAALIASPASPSEGALPVATILAAVGYGFALPAVALLHARNAPHRASGAVLATIAAVAALVAGTTGARAASLAPLAIWWWTLGKMSWETGTLPPLFGRVTAGLAILSLAAVLATAEPRVLDGSRMAIGAWLLLLAVVLFRE